MNPLARRLLDIARKREDRHLADARRAVLRQFRCLSLATAEKALTRALSLPAAKRPAAIREALTAIREASAATGTPPAALLGIMRRATHDRVLNGRDLALLIDPALVFPEPAELAARAVAKQRQDMNRYWAHESVRFRDDSARTVREAIRRGLTPEQAADLLQERLKVHRSRAVLIAQDQLLTASSRAEIDLLKAAGVPRFMWQTMGDNRVRKAHAALHGQVFTWRSAPELPGRAVRCRCRAVLPPDTLDAAPRNMLQPAHPSTTPPENLPMPSKRDWLDGPLEARLDRLFADLQQRHLAARGPAPYFLAQDEKELSAIINLLKVDPKEARASLAFYAPRAHAIVVTPKLREMLDSTDIRHRLAGTRYVLHEYWHAMRPLGPTHIPLEEGGAELFADALLERYTGVNGKLRRIQLYAGFATAVEQMGEAAAGAGNALQWVLASRSTPDTATWLRVELRKLQAPETEVEAVVAYNSVQRGVWTRLVDAALRGTKS